MKASIRPTLILALCLCLAKNGFAAPQDATLLIHSGRVLTMDATARVLQGGVVVVSGDRIVAVGGPELLDRYSAEHTIDARGGIVMPGMINLHNHLPMIAFRGLGENGVRNRLYDFFFPLEKALLSRELIRISARQAAIESAVAGVTTITDMYYYEDEVATAVKDVGLRGVLGETVIGFPVVDAATPEAGLAYAEDFIRRFRNDPLITPAVAPHAPYTVSPELLGKVRELAERYDVPILMHVAEMPDEKARVMAAFKDVPPGLSIIEYLAHTGILVDRLVAAHVIHVDDEDIALLRNNQVGIGHNPISNTKGSTGLAPAWEMYQRELAIGLGTDGPMSGNQMDMLGTLRQAAIVARTRGNDSVRFTPFELVHMVTVGGARALDMEDRIGSLEAGKLADIVVIAADRPNMTPLYDPYAALVFQAYPGDVMLTVVNGDIVARDGVAIRIDRDAHAREWARITDRVKRFADEELSPDNPKPF
ncbi:MAG: amidohydrolase [Halieaceae bacterium]|jgi:cytosine/adenosine deaminase-related metal-dependent hydrolase|nr:amidohydrolase [Halieaceae bacterium]